MKLDHEDALHVQSADGWLDLGMASDALAELKQIPEAKRRHPLVLMQWWRALAALQRWRECVEVADESVQFNPNKAWGWIHRSYALHELKRTQEAADLLEPALAKFPKDELIAYNLACYACQLGRTDEAKALLAVALRRGDAKEIRKRALDDFDLAPIREHVVGLHG